MKNFAKVLLISSVILFSCSVQTYGFAPTIPSATMQIAIKLSTIFNTDCKNPLTVSSNLNLPIILPIIGPKTTLIIRLKIHIKIRPSRIEPTLTLPIEKCKICCNAVKNFCIFYPPIFLFTRLLKYIIIFIVLLVFIL